MSTICADELFRDNGGLHDRETVRRHPVSRAATPRRETTTAPAAATRRRYEDFEARSSHLGDLLGGHVFPRMF